MTIINLNFILKTDLTVLPHESLTIVWSTELSPHSQLYHGQKADFKYRLGTRFDLKQCFHFTFYIFFKISLL